MVVRGFITMVVQCCCGSGSIEGGGSEVDRRREVSEKEFQFPLDIFFSFWGSLFLAAIFQWLLQRIDGKDGGKGDWEWREKGLEILACITNVNKDMERREKEWESGGES